MNLKLWEKSLGNQALQNYSLEIKT